MMETFNSETDSDYTSYWKDWVSHAFLHLLRVLYAACGYGKVRRAAGHANATMRLRLLL